MKCFVFLVATTVNDGQICYELDGISEMASYSLVDDFGVNPYDVYKQRSTLIGKDHQWSVDASAMLERDQYYFGALDMRKRFNERLTMHSIQTLCDSFDKNALHELFQSKIENNEIVDFLKESET